MKNYNKAFEKIKKENGQSLVEVLVALAVGAILVGAAAFAIAATLRSSANRERSQAASTLAEGLLNTVHAIARANWSNIYEATKLTPYFATSTNGTLTIQAGSETVVLNNFSYTRHFLIEDVCRESGVASAITSCGSGGIGDPSTQKITAYVAWSAVSGASSLEIERYITRWQNASFVQSDWSGGDGELGPFDVPGDVYATSTDIDTQNGSLRINGL